MDASHDRQEAGIGGDFWGCRGDEMGTGSGGMTRGFEVEADVEVRIKAHDGHARVRESHERIRRQAATDHLVDFGPQDAGIWPGAEDTSQCGGWSTGAGRAEEVPRGVFEVCVVDDEVRRELLLARIVPAEFVEGDATLPQHRRDFRHHDRQAIVFRDGFDEPPLGEVGFGSVSEILWRLDNGWRGWRPGGQPRDDHPDTEDQECTSSVRGGRRG